MNYKWIDYGIAMTAAGIAARISFAIVPLGWNMIAAMVLGMVTGMLVQVPVAFILMPLFGAFEVMLPAMLAGIISGMAAGMLAAGTTLSGFPAFLVGLPFGFLVAYGVRQKNQKLKGEVEACR